METGRPDDGLSALTEAMEPALALARLVNCRMTLRTVCKDDVPGKLDPALLKAPKPVAKRQSQNGAAPLTGTQRQN